MDTKSSNAIFRVLYFGDSLTEGSEMPPDQKAFVWPTLVQEASGGTFQAINEGLGGRPTNSVSAFQKILDYHDHAFDLMVIALGGNDARDISGQCVPNAVRNIREMIALTRAARPGIPILLVGPANIRKDTLGPTKSIGAQRDQNLRDLTAAYEALAAETPCRFVALYGVIPPASLAADGVHPDADGNRAVAAKMLEALAQLASANA
jgi:acyl-CoA thioesterase-1